MIIAIDGPAGAGKSTTAREVAQRFGFAYIDTGAMYRAVALAASERGLRAGRDDAQIAALAGALPLSFSEDGTRISIGERDVSGLIRRPEMGALTSAISSLPAVRHVVVEQQRRLGRESVRSHGGAVFEGRDIQTVVFPDAPVKIFLTADAGTRAARRLEQWRETGASEVEKPTGAQKPTGDAASEQLQRDISERDERDSTRCTSPLRPAADAVLIATDDLSPAEVVERIAAIVRQKMDHP